MIRPHDPECYCDTCSALGLGALLYREIAEELASDDPEVIEPIWRARSEERIAAHKSQRIEAAAALLALLLPERRYAAAQAPARNAADSSAPLDGGGSQVMARLLRDWRRWGRLVACPKRERLGLSCEQLARTAAITVNSIARLELGRTRRPNLRVLRSLCNALDLPLPGDEGLYLSLDGVAAEKLRRLVAAALYEFARRRRDAARFASLIHLPRDATQLRLATATVTAERDLAIDVWGALCPELDPSALDPTPKHPPRPRRNAVPPRPPHRIPRHVERSHG